MSESERVRQQHGRPSPGDKAGPRRMPGGSGAERNGPRLGNTGATRGRYPQRSVQEFDRFHGF